MSKPDKLCGKTASARGLVARSGAYLQVILDRLRVMEADLASGAGRISPLPHSVQGLDFSMQELGALSLILIELSQGPDDYPQASLVEMLEKHRLEALACALLGSTFARPTGGTTPEDQLVTLF